MWRFLASVSYLAHQASAHGGALNYTVGDTWYPGYEPFAGPWQDTLPTIVQRKWITNDPIFSPSNASLACNYPGTPAHSSIPIRAGQNITAAYASWVHTVGPMIAWLTLCPSDGCGSYDPVEAGADWFKIGEKGLEAGTIETGDWFQKTFSRWDGSPSLWSENIPESLRPGAYLVRHEIISLHSSHKPQFYPECAHLEVSGEGDSFPGKEYMVKIPGVWRMDMPEINIDPYDPETSVKTEYKIPGPPVWTG